MLSWVLRFRNHHMPLVPMLKYAIERGWKKLLRGSENEPSFS